MTSEMKPKASPKVRRTMSPKCKQLESELKVFRYPELDARMRELALSDQELMELMNARSRKVASVAFEVLGSRGIETTRLVAEALIAGKFTHKIARIVASNFLLSSGRRALGALPAYLYLLNDRHEDVAGMGLFGIVFLRRRDCIPRIEQLRDSLPMTSRLRAEAELAIKAINEDNPLIYGRGYSADEDLWGVKCVEAL